MFKLGILIFFGVHLIPFVKNLKLFLQDRLGDNFYKGLFSLVSLLGLLLIIFGYENNSNFLYSVNDSVYLYSHYIMFISFTLLIAANMPTFIQKVSKHPMSLGIAIWAILHLMTNSDINSVILFGSFLGYSVISVLFSEFIYGPQVKEINPKITFDILSLALGALLTFLAYNFHDYLSGTSLS